MEPAQIEHTADITRVALEAVLGAADARSLYASLNSAVSGAASIVMDGRRVERIDAAALQILAIFCRAVRERGLTIAWQSPSNGLRQAAQALGLQAILEMNP